MKKMKLLSYAGISVLILTTSCSEKNKETSNNMTNNHLLSEWTGPYSGVPAFDKMDITGLQEAMETAMQNHLKEIDAIANNPEAPTFENTLLAMEKSGAELNRLYAYYGIWSGNMSTPEFRDIQTIL